MEQIKTVAPRRVACVCRFKCSQLTYTSPSGATLPGQLVHPSTRLSHRKKDQEIDKAIPPSQSPPLQGPDKDVRLEQSKYRMALPAQSLEAVEGAETAAKAGDGSTSIIIDGPMYVQTAVCLLAAWLHLVAGLSRESVNTTMKAINIIAMLVFNLSYALAKKELSQTSSDSSPSPPLDMFSLPVDVRTAMLALSLEPSIIRIICCPKCFKNYREEDVPDTGVCDYRETERSHPCNETLYTTRNTRGGPKSVPRCRFSIQDFESWLDYFLSCPGIEEAIEKSYQHQPNTNKMNSIWDSPAWLNGLPGFSTFTRGNLTFGYFIDWFNPFTNKIAGKIASAGAIMFFCLNLSNELQCRPEYTYFAGITPPPKEPSVETITALSDPIIKQFVKMWSGKIICSSFYPNGLMRRVAILAALGDLLAMRKALGFAGVGSNAHFCSFCRLHKDNIEELDITCFIPRIGSHVAAVAKKWKDASTKVERKKIFAQDGVRWSSLHLLQYRDPVKHTVLGVMHNWIEGVLQHHTRHRWGIGADKAINKKESNLMDIEDAALPVDVVDEDGDIIMAGVDDNHPDDTQIAALDMEFFMCVETPDLGSNNTNTDSDNSSESNFGKDDSEPSELDSETNSDSESESFTTPTTFTMDELTQIRACLTNTIVPSWVERPPTNLGEKSHGKLKADHWLKLYTVFLPLILPEIWQLSTSESMQNDRYRNLLSNFHSLTICTHKVCAYDTSIDDADLYLHHYISYRHSAQSLFPHAPSRPNHHYAMHNAELLKYWGPLIRLSEFPFERHNGALQKIKTNNHMWELDYTMLRQVCKRGRLKASLQKHAATPDKTEDSESEASGKTAIPDPLAPNIPLQQLSNLLSQAPRSNTEPNQLNSTNLERLDNQHYSAWLKYMNDPCLQQPTYRNHTAFPHPDGANVLSPYTTPLRRVYHLTRLYTPHNTHAGNASIIFQHLDGSVSAGFIQAMWEHPKFGAKEDSVRPRQFVLVAPHKRLSTADEKLNPYTALPGLKADLVYAQVLPPKDHFVIEKENIIAHLPYYIRPRGTFGIKQSTLILVNSLQRNI